MAKIKIKGSGWVNNVDDSIAYEIKKDWEDTNVPRTQLVEVGEYTIPLSDIQGFFVKSRPKEVVFDKLSDEELAKLNLTLEKYRIRKTLSNGEEISFCQWEEWLVEQGVMSKGTGVYKDQYWVADTDKYPAFMEKINQWHDWLSRREYGKKFADRQLDEVAQSMVVGEVDN